MFDEMSSLELKLLVFLYLFFLSLAILKQYQFQNFHNLIAAADYYYQIQEFYLYDIKHHKNEYLIFFKIRKNFFIIYNYIDVSKIF